MPPLLLHRLPDALRRAVLALLLAALPLYGLAGTLAQMLGHLHIHAPASGQTSSAAAGSMAGWQDFRRVDHAPLHVHADAARHVHAAGAADVVDFDAGASSADEGTASGLGAWLALMSPAAAPAVLPDAARHAWPSAAGLRLASRPLARLDRPPRG